MSLENYQKLLTCHGIEFFNILEEVLETSISIYLKNIILLNGLDSAVRFMKFDDSTVTEIEDFMQNDFEIEMVPDSDTVENYLGTFKTRQKKFKLLSGHKLLLNMVKETCQNAFQSHLPITKGTRTKPESTSLLKQKIGGQMITVFNDAKKITLSAWSWPSRQVASVLSAEYQANGCCDANINFQYLTPGHHKDLLDSIVRSDIPNLRFRIVNALAISLRVDGSTDRTQDHNVFVMATLVYVDGSIETIFLGFKIPEIVKSPALPADAYLQVVKDSVCGIISWEDLFSKTTSIVTDGENINTGDMNGLCIKLIRERLNSTNFLIPFISIWCVAHRINLAWKDICKNFLLISNVITSASNLSSYFHRSGQRTQKLKNISLENPNEYQKFIRYPPHFEVRWTQFTYSLFTSVLRNWKASIQYFKNENQTRLQKIWLNFDRIHLITFLSDILKLYQTFQKTFEFDSISVLDIKSKKNELVQKYIKMKTAPLHEGWEELFLNNTVTYENQTFFHGHKLIRNNRGLYQGVRRGQVRLVNLARNGTINRGRNRRGNRGGNCGVNRGGNCGGNRGGNRGSNRNGNRGVGRGLHRRIYRTVYRGVNQGIITFNTIQRTKIIDSLIDFLNDRLDSDLIIYQRLEPLFKYDTSATEDSLKDCYSLIIPDLNEQQFYSEYRIAAERLASDDCKGPLNNLKKLISISEDQFTTLKTALARIAAAKPHSADVERLINIYNKFKDDDRCSFSPATLFNNLYINLNMGPLEKFDPSSAVQHWMNVKDRKPRPSSKSKQQEWFVGVFEDAHIKIRNGSNQVKF